MCPLRRSASLVSLQDPTIMRCSTGDVYRRVPRASSSSHQRAATPNHTGLARLRYPRPCHVVAQHAFPLCPRAGARTAPRPENCPRAGARTGSGSSASKMRSSLPQRQPLAVALLPTLRLSGRRRGRRRRRLSPSSRLCPSQWAALPFFSALPVSVLFTLAAKRSEERLSW